MGNTSSGTPNNGNIGTIEDSLPTVLPTDEVERRKKLEKHGKTNYHGGYARVIVEQGVPDSTSNEIYE